MRSIFPASALLLTAVIGCQSEGRETIPPFEQDDRDLPSALVSGDELPDTFSHEEGWLLSPRLAAPDGATRVALLIDLYEDGAAPAVVQARGYSDGDAADWVPAEIVWSEGVYAVGRADLGFVADEVQVRVPAGHEDVLSGLQYEAVTPEVPAAGVALAPAATSEHGLASYLRDIGVVSRGQWGARGTRCTAQDASKSRIAVHHTVTAPSLGGNYAARVRQIQSFHMDGRGWCDVGYHFLITRNGRVFEGRPVHLLGAHVGNHNTDNIGVSFVGCFQPGACSGIASTSVPEKMIKGGARLIRRLANRHDIPRTGSRIKGHRDHSGAYTSCPGDNLHARLGDLRSYTAPIDCSKVKRLAEETRYQTAAKFSRNNFDRARRVVLVSGKDGDPGAVVAGPLARRHNGPVLFTAKRRLPWATRQELVRLGARKVFVVGNRDQVAPRVLNRLRGMGLTVVRVGERGRFEVAADVARRVGAPDGIAFVVRGGNLMDGVSAAAAAAALRAPLLYVTQSSVPGPTQRALDDLGVNRVFLVGGGVSPAVRNALPNVKVIKGDNRLQTAARVANLARRRGAGTHRVHVTRNDKTRFGVLVGATGRLVLLSQKDSLGAAPRTFLKKHANRVTLMGGSGALSGDVRRAVCRALQ